MLVLCVRFDLRGLRVRILHFSACEVVAVEVRAEEAEEEVEQLAGVEAEADADAERGGGLEVRPGRQMGTGFLPVRRQRRRPFGPFRSVVVQIEDFAAEPEGHEDAFHGGVVLPLVLSARVHDAVVGLRRAVDEGLCPRSCTLGSGNNG